jgi:pSer/pThr/pTyr-binding forkhead associated (FHA) protein
VAGVLKYKYTSIARQSGELARLRVTQGPDLGVIYLITQPTVVIGRGEDTDVTLFDLKTSRRHAQLQSTSLGWTVQDAGSANGILVNGVNQSRSVVRTGDLISLGETILEFLGADATESMLNAPLKSIEQAQNEMLNFRIQQNRVQAMANPFSLNAGAEGAAKRTKFLLMIGVIGLALILFSGEEKPVKKSLLSKNPMQVSPRDLAQYLPKNDPSSRISEQFFKEGFREYKDRNYVRARQKFETVLQVAPGHANATYYLKLTTEAVEQSAQKAIELGRKAKEAGKHQEARAHYESVLRLFYRDATHTKFLDAKKQLDELNALDRVGGGS